MKKIISYLLSFCVFALVFTHAFAKETEKDVKKPVKKQTVEKADKANSETTAPTTTPPKPLPKKDAVVKEEVKTDTPQSTLNINSELGNYKPLQSSSAAGEQINWQVISSGGNRGTSTNYILSGTIGQTAVGLGTSTNYMVNSGFWQNFSAASGCCIGIRGNVDGDGLDQTDIADLVYFVSYSFGGGPAPICFEEADMDASLGLDIGDIVYLVSYSFGGGPAPLPC